MLAFLNPLDYIPSFADVILIAVDLLLTIADLCVSILGRDNIITASIQLPIALLRGPVFWAFQVALILLDPFFNTSLMLELFTLCMVAWAVSTVIRLAIYAKGHFWSSSN